MAAIREWNGWRRPRETTSPTPPDRAMPAGVLKPRGFRWIISARLAVSERLGGLGVAHRKVRRQQEVLWLQKEAGITDVVSLLGATNVGAEQGLRSYQRISTEEIAVWDPEWIVTGADPGQRDRLERELLADPGIAVTSAARTGQILILPQHVFLSVSHDVIRLIESMAEALYPEGL